MNMTEACNISASEQLSNLSVKWDEIHGDQEATTMQAKFT
jgi:hypothetical protein